jgi:uncharacterized protein
MKAEDYIKALNMQEHPEGGWFVETYRSAREIDLPDFDGSRSMATSILFLIPEGKRSALHRIKSDEIWYYHAGGALDVIELDADGKERRTVVGPEILKGQRLQYVVAAGNWFGAEPHTGSGFCLVGCQVSPGFDFADFELL